MNDRNVILHNFKTIIIDDDFSILKKNFEHFKKDKCLIEDLMNEMINSLSLVQYVCKNNQDKILNYLIEKKFDVNLVSEDNQDEPLMLAIINHADKVFKILAKNKKIKFVFNNGSNVYLELAKQQRYDLIKWMIKNNIAKNLLKMQDSDGNSILNFIKDRKFCRSLIKIEKKLAELVDSLGNNFLLVAFKEKDRETAEFILKNTKYKIATLNYEDRNIIHYIFVNKWYDLLDKLEITSNKKELLIFDIYGYDLFMYLLETSNLELIDKWYPYFRNNDCILHYINSMFLFSNGTIEYFFKKESKKMSEEIILELIILLLEERKIVAVKKIIDLYTFKSSFFYDLILYVLEKYSESFK